VVHNDHSRIGAVGRASFAVANTVLCLLLIAGCGGGGSASVVLRGILTDGFGAVINLPGASVTLDGTGEVAHPDENGAFSLSAAPGTYTLRGNLTDTNRGLLLAGSMKVELVKGQTLDIGEFPISSNSLDEGWKKYRNGDFSGAEAFFLDYLHEVRSAQASLGSSAVESALGWTRGRGLDRAAEASVNFRNATDGWSGNVDALVGLAASELSRMRSDGSFHFNQSVSAVTSAIESPGDYSSAPAHDRIHEIDLLAFRSFVNYLNRNVETARIEAEGIDDRVATDGSRASADAIEIVLAFAQ